MVFALFSFHYYFRTRKLLDIRSSEYYFIISDFHLSPPAILTCCKWVLDILSNRLLSSCWETRQVVIFPSLCRGPQDERVELLGWSASHCKKSRRALAPVERCGSCPHWAPGGSFLTCSSRGLSQPPETGGHIHFLSSLLGIQDTLHAYSGWCQPSSCGFQKFFLMTAIMREKNQRSAG